MAFRLSRAASALRVSPVRRAGGQDRPRWTLPSKDYHKYTYQPSLPDKHFSIGHWNYAPITLWLRDRRPTMERVIVDVWGTVKSAGSTLATPIMTSADRNLPGFGYKVIGLVGVLLGYSIFAWYVLSRTEAFMFLEKLRLYAIGEELARTGFFRSDVEEADRRQQAYAADVERLNSIWETALAEATEAGSFAKLCEHLRPDERQLPVVEPPVSWRFSMMPYGREDANSKTFGWPSHDSPRESNLPLLDLGSVGDYVDRQDNKFNPIRKGRHMYAAAYFPPTK